MLAKDVAGSLSVVIAVIIKKAWFYLFDKFHENIKNFWTTIRKCEHRGSSNLKY